MSDHAAPAEKDAPCGWCHHPINSKPPFDCRNPMHAERTAENDAGVGTPCVGGDE